MKKYLVICVSAESGVCSINPFDTEKEANEFLKKDSENNYDEYSKENVANDVEFDSADGYAQITDGGFSWVWTVHLLEL